MHPEAICYCQLLVLMVISVQVVKSFKEMFET